jgi:hypothetical protein
MLRKAAVTTACIFVAVCCAIVVLILLLVSADNTKSAAKIEVSSNVSSSQASQQNLPDFSADIANQAKLYDSSDGRVALSMIICKLDSSYSYSSLVDKSAKELFDILSESAFEKNITLESLDNKYGLSDILASEKIYVIINSNNVSSVPRASKKTSKDSEKSTSGSEQWMTKFKTAIQQPVDN